MPRVMALRPLNRMARRLLLPQGLMMRARPAIMRRTRRRPRSIAIPASIPAGDGVVRHILPRPAPVPPGSGQLLRRSTTHPLQVLQQQQQQQQQSSLTAVSYDAYQVATRFVNLLKASLNSPGMFLTMLQILKAFRDTLEREGLSADMFNTVRQVDEVLQEYPTLIIAFWKYFT